MLKRSAAGAPPGAACGNLQVHLDQRKGEVGSDQAGGHKLADRRDQLDYTTYLLAMHVVIAGERSDGSVGANAAVLEAQSAKTTLFFMSWISRPREMRQRQKNEFGRSMSKNFVIFSGRLIAWYRTEEPEL